MLLGKAKCKILKEIRQKIADENDIPYVTRECTYQGDCSGTCPKCEAELRELERQLAMRQKLGKKVAVTALCAGMAAVSVGCSPLGPFGVDPTAGSVPNTDYGELEGEPVEQPLEGDVLADPDSEIYELEGDVAAEVEGTLPAVDGTADTTPGAEGIPTAEDCDAGENCADSGADCTEGADACADGETNCNG